MFQQLNSVFTYTRDFITLNDLLNLYQQLINQYQDARNEPNNEEKIKVFQDTRQKITDIHSFVNYSAWSAPKLKILEKIGASNLIGEAAINTMTSCFSEFEGAKTVEGLTNLRTQSEQLLSKVNQTITNLSMTDDARIEDSPEGLVEITFGNDSYQNFWKLGKRSESWEIIFNLFARVTHEDFESVKLVSVASGSDMATLWTGAKGIIGMLIKAGKVVIELKKLKDLFFNDKSELKGKYGLQEKTVELVIGERTTRYKREYEEQKNLLSLKIVKEYRGDRKDDGENINELANAVALAIEKMVTESNIGANVLSPTEIKPIEAPKQDSLGVAYKEENRLASDVSKMIEEEQKNDVLLQGKAMRKELMAQIKKTGIKSIVKTDKKKTEKEEKKVFKENKKKVVSAEVEVEEPKK